MTRRMTGRWLSASTRYCPNCRRGSGERVAGETHGSAVELSTDPHAAVGDAVDQVQRLRATLSQELAAVGLRTASAGTHPFAVWSEMQIAGGDRHQAVYGSMRELARREPTFALHVHIGVGDPERAIVLYNRLRGHLALLLALATNSPFWQGRDTGLASARIPIFQAFPRVGVPRLRRLRRVRRDGRPAPALRGVPRADLSVVGPAPAAEVRHDRGAHDGRPDPGERHPAAGRAAAVDRSLELEEGYLAPDRIGSPEVLAENRFIAARDGIHARLIDPSARTAHPCHRDPRAS